MSQQLSHQQPIIVANEKIDFAEKDEKIRKLEQVSGIILAKWQNGMLFIFTPTLQPLCIVSFFKWLQNFYTKVVKCQDVPLVLLTSCDKMVEPASHD